MTRKGMSPTSLNAFFCHVHFYVQAQYPCPCPCTCPSPGPCKYLSPCPRHFPSLYLCLYHVLSISMSISLTMPISRSIELVICNLHFHVDDHALPLVMIRFIFMFPSVHFPPFLLNVSALYVFFSLCLFIFPPQIPPSSCPPSSNRLFLWSLVSPVCNFFPVSLPPLFLSVSTPMPLSYVSPPQSLLCLFPSSLVLIYTLCLSLPFSMLLSLPSVSFLLSLPLSLSLVLSLMSLLYACPPGLSSVSSAQSLVFFSPPCIFPSIEPSASHHLSSTFSFPLTLPLYLFHSVCPPTYVSKPLSLPPSLRSRSP
jgi:hypothetical protein